MVNSVVSFRLSTSCPVYLLCFILHVCSACPGMQWSPLPELVPQPTYSVWCHNSFHFVVDYTYRRPKPTHAFRSSLLMRSAIPAPLLLSTNVLWRRRKRIPRPAFPWSFGWRYALNYCTNGLQLYVLSEKWDLPVLRKALLYITSNPNTYDWITSLTSHW